MPNEKHWRIKIIIYSFVGLSVTTFAMAQDHLNNKVLTGSEIQTIIQNKELTDRVHYKYVFHGGGHLDGVEMSSHFTGKWYIQQDQLCWLVDDPQATEECFVVKKDGEEFNFSSDHESWQGFVYPIDVAPPPAA